MDTIRVTLPNDVKVSEHKFLNATTKATQELIATLTNALKASQLANDYARGLRSGEFLTRENVDVFTEKFMSGTPSASARKIAARAYTHLMELTLDNKIPLRVTCTTCRSLIHEQSDCTKGKHLRFSDYHYQYLIDIQSLRTSAVKIGNQRKPGLETTMVIEKLLNALTA